MKSSTQKDIQYWGNARCASEEEFIERMSVLYAREAFEDEELQHSRKKYTGKISQLTSEYGDWVAEIDRSGVPVLSSDGAKLGAVLEGLDATGKMRAASAKHKWLVDKKLTSLAKRMREHYQNIYTAERRERKMYQAGWTATILSSMFRKAKEPHKSSFMCTGILLDLEELKESDVFLECAICTTCAAALYQNDSSVEASKYIARALKLNPNSAYALNVRNMIKNKSKRMQSWDDAIPF